MKKKQISNIEELKNKIKIFNNKKVENKKL